MRTIERFGVASRVIGAVALAMLAVLPVWAQQPAQTPPSPTPPTQTMPMQGAPGGSGMMRGQGGMPGTATGPAGRAMMQSMQKMQQSMMSAPLSGDADRDFAAMMIPHHQGAIDMARTELQYGKDPTLRRMARGIIAAQQKEIREFRQWQTKHPASR